MQGSYRWAEVADGAAPTARYFFRTASSTYYPSQTTYNHNPTNENLRASRYAHKTFIVNCTVGGLEVQDGMLICGLGNWGGGGGD